MESQRAHLRAARTVENVRDTVQVSLERRETERKEERIGETPEGGIACVDDRDIRKGVKFVNRIGGGEEELFSEAFAYDAVVW